MLFLLLESIQLYGELKDSNTDILIYTSTQFMKVIKLCPYPIINELTKFEINDNYKTVEKACKARLDLFDLLVPTNKKYNYQKNLYQKILYLDTDIIVKGNLQNIFDLCHEDKLYVLEEGSINSDTDFWGKTLFQNAGDLELYTNKMDAFTSGILLFNNCEKIKELFTAIQKDMIARPFKFYCHDQPYIVYNAFKYDLYDNQILKPFAVNNDHDVFSSKTIHHFPGDPGMHQNKLKYMVAFLTGLKQLHV
jgi:lipopolysaccharide biosynthesis glycosyltransferase